MKPLDEMLLSDVRATLVRGVRSLAGQRSLDEVFAAWLLPNENLGLVPEEAAIDAGTHKGASRSYHDVALLGFRADAGLIQANEIEALEEGLLWLAGRPSSVNDTPTGVCVDAIGVLGVALGARSLGEGETRNLVSRWLALFIYSSYRMRDVESWQKCLLAAAQRIAQIKPDLTIPDDDLVADVRVVLADRELIEIKEGEEGALRAVKYLKSLASTSSDPIRQALSLAAHNVLVNASFASKPEGRDISATARAIGQRRIKILFLAAEPVDEVRLRLGEEVREIEKNLLQSAFPDRFTIEQQWAVRIADLQGYLMRHQPDIVHFSGHGSVNSEIILEDLSGNNQPVPVKALQELFAILKDNIRCVVLNACYSEQQATAIAQHIDCVVGMSKTIVDQAAISFSASFYQALAFGRNVEEAYKLGCNQIQMENLKDEDVPKLVALNSNARDIIFVARG